MKHTFPYGTGVALITPFLSDNRIDFNALGAIIDYNIRRGVDYFVVLGTTGESVTLRDDEKQDIYRFAVTHVDKRVPLVAGVGGNHTAELVRQLEQFNTDGYSAFLSVSPYYNKPTQEGIFQHYLALEKVSPLPIILYNVPGRTSSNINADTCLRLAQYSKKFIAIKEASGNMAQIMQIIKHKPAHFQVISGDDNLTLPLMSVGGIGVISVVAQALPKTYSSMVDAVLLGDMDTARQLHYKMLDVMDLFFAEGNPSGIKAALHSLQLCHNLLRLPLVPVSDTLYLKLKQALQEFAEPVA
ncbi:MAG: 4-hydroxy-tetrahydrodipicolinate synthase [Bacteroidota bacterium]|jgi:4-hydroxy-tetrahydrodipicolinate synthase